MLQVFLGGTLDLARADRFGIDHRDRTRRSRLQGVSGVNGVLVVNARGAQWFLIWKLTTEMRCERICCCPLVLDVSRHSVTVACVPHVDAIIAQSEDHYRTNRCRHVLHGDVCHGRHPEGEHSQNREHPGHRGQEPRPV